MEIIINCEWHSATIKVGAFRKNVSLPGGFKKYTLVNHIRRINFLPPYTMSFNDSMVGFSALYVFVDTHGFVIH